MKEIKKQASNIDEQGNVLYLDEERLKRKEVPFPPYKNKPNGLGIYNFLKDEMHADVLIRDRNNRTAQDWWDRPTEVEEEEND